MIRLCRSGGLPVDRGGLASCHGRTGALELKVHALLYRGATVTDHLPGCMVGSSQPPLSWTLFASEAHPLGFVTVEQGGTLSSSVSSGVHHTKSLSDPLITSQWRDRKRQWLRILPGRFDGSHFNLSHRHRPRGKPIVDDYCYSTGKRCRSTSRPQGQSRSAPAAVLPKVRGEEIDFSACGADRQVKVGELGVAR